MLPGLQHFEGERGVLELRDGTRKNDKHLITHTDLHKLNNKLVNAQLKHFWCQDEPRANLNSQDSPQLGFRGSHHLPPYSILYASPQGPHPNGILSRDSHLIAKVGILAILEPYNFACRSLIEMKFEAKLQPRQKFSNGMLHATCTQGNRVDSRLFVVWSQTANLAPDFSFGHNLCFRCPNGHATPFYTFKVQELSNDIRNFLSHSILTPTIAF